MLRHLRITERQVDYGYESMKGTMMVTQIGAPATLIRWQIVKGGACRRPLAQGWQRVKT